MLINLYYLSYQIPSLTIMNNFSNSPSPNRSNPFITLTGKSHNRMMNAALWGCPEACWKLNFQSHGIDFPRQIVHPHKKGCRVGFNGYQGLEHPIITIYYKTSVHAEENILKIHY